jgi:hypothetical protein
MLAHDRASNRCFFAETWRKRCARLALEGVVSGVLAWHPARHDYLGATNAAANEKFKPERGETNPGPHLGMHLAVLRQVQTDCPHRIAPPFRATLNGVGDAHGVEHQLMEYLAEAPWTARRKQRPLDEAACFDCAGRRLLL